MRGSHNKIIGIGLNKTGTSTLGEIGRSAGLACKTWDAAVFDSAFDDPSRALFWRAVEQHDLLEDFPYPLLYREIDARVPGCAFVLTRRSTPERWLASLKAHAMRARPGTRTNRLVYGRQYPHGHEQAFLDYYRRHNDAAREYFRGRGDDFIEICWEEEDSLDRLARFLGIDLAAAKPPRANPRKAPRLHYFAWNLAARILANR